MLIDSYKGTKWKPVHQSSLLEWRQIRKEHVQTEKLDKSDSACSAESLRLSMLFWAEKEEVWEWVIYLRPEFQLL